MDAVSLTIGLCWLLSSGLLAGLAMPLVRGRVGRNGLYGVRLSQSLKSDAAWRAINRYGGRVLIGVAIAGGVAGLAVLPLRLNDRPGLSLALGLLPLAFHAAGLVLIVRFARRYDRDQNGAVPGSII